MRRVLVGLFMTAFFACNITAQNEVNSDQWVATDALGRKVREYGEAGDKRKDKFIAVFYWTWHQGNDDTTYQNRNITEIVR
ncbi:MAG: hypothetical protein LBJ72_07365, partial [Dysgonamonadaceae bacterium]|nr:hypothetical protein [Dysgonamonadaceae bacterium]